MSLIRKPWTTQPQFPAPPNRGASWAGSLRGLLLPPGGLTDSVSGTVATRVNSPGLLTSSIGVYAECTTTGTKYWTLPSSTALNLSGAFTIIWFGVVGDNGARTFVAKGNGFSTNTPFVCYANGSNFLGISRGGAGDYQIFSGSSVTVPNSGTAFIAWMQDGVTGTGKTARGFCNGNFDTLTGGGMSDTTATSNASVVTIGNQLSGGGPMLGGPVVVAFFNKVLSDSEIRGLYANPWQLFAPLPRRIWAPAAGGGGGATGTVAYTNQNDSIAASGTPTVLGALARTNANDTSAASGTTTVAGTLARTNASDTSVASGSVGSAVSGTVAYTNAADAAAASGTTTVGGTLSRANANDTAAASGTTTVVGTVTRTNANDTASASGSAGSATGTVAYTNANDTASAAGKTTIIGALSRTNANDIVVSDGWAGIVIGTVARTNANDTSVAAGTVADGVIIDRGALAARRRGRRRTLRATSARDINYMWRRIEPTDGNSPVYREQVPGLTLRQSFTGAYRGGWWTGSRAFVVYGATLYEIFSDDTNATLGTLQTSTGIVDFAQGLFQLVLVDGANGYVLTLATDAFAKITDPDFYGSKRVSFLDGRWQFVRPDTQQFYWNDTIDDATDFDALGFKSAESQPDNVVAHIVDHRELIMFGELTTEPFLPIPSGDEIYQRNNGGVTETGCAATHTAQKLDNSYIWVGQDRNGRGMVLTAGGQNGSQPLRISDHDTEEALTKSTDLSGAWAFTEQSDGQTFYFLNAPGLTTTRVYDASVKRWHERAEWSNGVMSRWRANGHLFAHGLHLVGDDAGGLYEIDPYEYTNAGDVLYREVTSPHAVAPTIKMIYFDRLALNIQLGQTSSGTDPMVEMQYSDDGGETWGGWIPASLGQIGDFDNPPVWHRLGRAKDRVWRFRVTDDCKAAIIGMDVTAREGTA